MAKASSNKGLLIGVVAVAAVALLALAYQLGRASAPEGVPPPPTKIERIAPRPQEAPPAAPTPGAALNTERADTRPAYWPTPAGQPTAPIYSGQSSAGSDSSRAAVAAYFDAVDHIQPEALSGEAEGVANEMAAALANGDTSSLDKMIRDTEASKQRLAGVTPPAPCATHYRESLASLDDALELLHSLKAAMQSADPAQLARVASRGNVLRSRADVLQREEQALRQRYGLKR